MLCLKVPANVATRKVVSFAIKPTAEPVLP